MRIGKQMQFFGARVNLAKTLLYALNGGRDELNGEQVGPMLAPVTGEALDYDEVLSRLDAMMDWLAKTYVNALNVIHFMHDKYCYESLEMALHDRDVLRTLACGIAGLSHTADSLSAIKYAQVKPVRDARGIIVDFETRGEYPCFGNNDDRVDDIAKMLVSMMMNKIREYPSYRNSVHTQSVLTITSNVVYGKGTGTTPDGRKKGDPFAPGANPSSGRDTHGALAALMSVAKIPYDDAEDGISLTLSVVPSALGSESERLTRGTGALDAYFSSGGFHVNINVLNRETLQDAMKHPEKYPQLTIRVSGYAVNFIKLTKEQQLDVINRTFHGSM
jgi:formate C-acetyltransferase